MDILEAEIVSPLEVKAEIQKYTLVGDDIFVKRYDSSTVPAWYKDMIGDLIENDQTINTIEGSVNYLSGLTTGYTNAIISLQDQDASILGNLESIGVSVGQNGAAIADLDVVKVNETQAQAIASTVIGSYFTGGQAASWFASEISTYASEIEAHASSIDTLSASLNGQAISISSLDTISTEAHEWSASAAKFITGTDGRITGWQLSDGSNAVSNMLVSAETFTLEDDTGNQAIMTADGLAFYKVGVTEPFKMVAKIQAGTASNNSTVTLTGFYKTPLVFVSQNEIMSFDATHANQSQKWQVRPENLAGSLVTGIWTFTAIARLIVSANNTSAGLAYTYSGSGATVTSTTYTSPAETTAITVSGSINSYRSTGTSGTYQKRKCTVVLQTSPNNSTWTNQVTQTIYHGVDLSSDLFSLSKTGLAQGVWYYRVQFTWADDTGTFTTSVGYDYFTRVVAPPNWNYDVEIGVYIDDDGLATRSKTLNVTYTPIATEEVLSGNFSYAWTTSVKPSAEDSGTDTGSYGTLYSETPKNTAYLEYTPVSGGSMVGSFASSMSYATTDASQVIVAKVFRARTPPMGYLRMAGTVTNINLTLYTRIPQVASTTATNVVASMSASFTLATTTILDSTGTLNYLAISY